MSEDYKLFLDDVVDLCNSQEASWVKFRLQIQKLLGETRPSAKLPFDVSKIKWQDRENEKGKFQMSADISNPDFKALLKFLNEHAGGKIVSEGWFYWVYPDASTIGRKLKAKAEAKL